MSVRINLHLGLRYLLFLFTQRNLNDLTKTISGYLFIILIKWLNILKYNLCLHTSKSNVVYKISCNNCDASYVGQMGRQLKTRITEHRNRIRHSTSVRPVITEHRLQYDYDFQWDNVKFWDEELCYKKRLISEMLNIKKQKNSLNLQIDTKGLHKAYIPIVNKVWLFVTDSPSFISVYDPY